MKKFWSKVKYFFSKDVWGEFFDDADKVIANWLMGVVCIAVIVGLLYLCFH